MTRHRLLFLTAFACCSYLATSAWAQPRFVRGSRSGDQLVNLFPSAPRPLKQHLSRAEKALQQNEYSAAIDELYAILTSADPESGGGQDFFAGQTAGKQAHTSIKARALELLGGMPERSLELYELRCGAEARALLDQAVAEGSLQQLTDVTRKFFHTQAGHEATMLIGRYHLDHGRPLAAALWLQRLAETAQAARRFDPELSVMLASSWLHAGMPPKAEAALIALRSRDPKATVRVGAGTIPIFREDTQALTWLEKVAGSQHQLRSADESQWLVFRGNSTRNARSSGGMPLMTRRWDVPIANDPTDQDRLETISRDFRARDLVAIPSVHALAVDNLILMRTPRRRLLAVDFETGKRVWEYPWFEDSDETRSDDSESSSDTTPNAPRRDDRLIERLWEDAAYGQISSDGSAVYLLDELTYASDITRQQQNRLMGGGMLEWPSQFAETHNKLVALSLRGQGKLRWIVGGKDGEDERRLAGAFFLGPPLPILGQLFVLAEMNGEIRLVVLDASNGQLQWAQQLAHVESFTVDLNGVRRLAGATPSFADGVLVCPTSAGAVVAVDISTRALLWGFQYQKGPTFPGVMRRGLGGESQLQPGEHWADASVTIAEGCVLITPIESNQLYCLDLLTGEPRWAPQQRGDAAYVASVHDGKLILAGKSRIQALSLKDGTAAWPSPVDLAGATPSGRGFLSGDHYFLPTGNAQLLKIDISRGEIAEAISTERVLGNLLCYRDAVVSQNVDVLSKYDQLEPLRAWVAQQRQAHPDDPVALTRQAELSLHDSQRPEALAALRRAYQLTPAQDPDRSTIQTLLVETLFSVLRSDFENNRDAALEVEALIDDPAQQAEFQRLMAAGLARTNEYERAFRMYLKLAGLEQSALGGIEFRSGLEQVEPHLKARAERRIQAHLAELLEAASGAERERIDEIVRAHFESTLSIGADQKPSRQFLDFFGTHPLADEVRVRLAAQVLLDKPTLETELWLRHAAQAADPAIAGAATWHLARGLHAAGYYDDAATHFVRLGREFGEVVCGEGKTGRELFDTATQLPKIRQALTPHEWPFGQWNVERQQRPMASNQAFAAIEFVDGAASRQLGYTPGANQLVIRDRFGRETNQVPLQQPQSGVSSAGPASAKAFGHFVMARIGNDFLALDTWNPAETSDKSILWRQSLQPLGIAAGSTRVNQPFGQGPRVVSNGAIGPVLPSGVYLQKDRQLVCLDPLTGDEIWVRDEIAPGSDVFGNEQHVFVVPPNSTVALVFGALDGRSQGRREIVPRENRWATFGGHVLSWGLDNGKYSVRLYDLFRERDVWRRELTTDAKGCLIGDDEAAFLEPDGTLEIVVLKDGQTQLKTQLLAEAQLSELYVLRSSDQYHVVVSSDSASNAGNFRIVSDVTLEGGASASLTSARIYAFDRHTGRSQWPIPARIRHYSLPLDQPADCPLLVFMRHFGETTSTRNEGHQHLELLCIDKRTGREMYRQDHTHKVTQTRAYRLEARPAENLVTLNLTRDQFTFRFTTEPLPPELPVQQSDGRSNRTLLDGIERVFRFLGISGDQEQTPPVAPK